MATLVALLIFIDVVNEMMEIGVLWLLRRDDEFTIFILSEGQIVGFGLALNLIQTFRSIVVVLMTRSVVGSLITARLGLPSAGATHWSPSTT